jgi:hypothetical protein
MKIQIKVPFRRRTILIRISSNFESMMQSSNEYPLTRQEIESGIQFIKRKVLRFFDDAKILANNNGDPAHSLALYLFGVEEFGKLLLLEDSLTASPPIIAL